MIRIYRDPPKRTGRDRALRESRPLSHSIKSAEGVEFEVDWLATERLRFSGGFAWLDAEFDNLMALDPLNPGVLGDFAGNQPRRSPEWTGNANISYDLPSGSNDGMYRISLDWMYKDDHFFDEFNNTRMFQESYVMVDARLRYQSPQDRWTAEI